MPLFHTGGCVLAVLGAASKGDHLILMEQFDPGLQLELLETFRPTITTGVPTMLIAVVNHPDFASRDISSVRYVLSGGAMVPPDLVNHIDVGMGATVGCGVEGEVCVRGYPVMPKSRSGVGVMAPLSSSFSRRRSSRSTTGIRSFRARRSSRASSRKRTRS